MSKAISTKSPVIQLNELDVEIYKQDCEFYRHQDRLGWSRFRTAIAIEGGLLLARLSTMMTNPFQHYAPLLDGPLLMLTLTTAAAVMTLVFFSLSLKDRVDARRHLKRIKEFEKGNPLTEETRFIVSGTNLMLTVIIAVSVVNVLVIVSWRP